MPRLRALLKSPPLAKGDAEQQLEELRDYLLQIVEELGYLLTHLEADNINDTTFERISQMIPKAFTGTPTMDGEGSPGTAPTWARGDHTHPKDSSKADVTALAAHIADSLNPHAVTKAQVGLGNVADERQYSAQNPPPVPSAEDVGAIPATEKGSAGGVAELDANGMVPSAQLPSYVDDVLEYASLSVFPVTGESGKIYVALDTNKTYRWSGSAYVEISESLALGETSSTAYRGDRGKAAYDHSQLTSGNPHNVTAAEAGAVPTSREVNGHALSSDISLTASDVGARADTWMPSASDVGAQPTITANGILKGDGAGGVSAAVAGTDYQAPLTIDATPTANSTNPVQSGGVYTDVRTRVPVYGLGKNLLDNWYFLNPVNQRGSSIYTAAGYTIDRWMNVQWQVTSPTVNVTSNGVRLQSSTAAGVASRFTFQQVPPSWIAGKTVTISLLYSGNTNDTARLLFVNNSTVIGSTQIPTGSGLVSKTIQVPSSLTDPSIQFGVNSSFGGKGPLDITLMAVKLELGSEQTLCHNEGTAETPVWVLNEVPDYEYELYRCMTSTADPSDTYANKSLATEQQLAYVESGTTARRDYLWDEFFWMGGILYRTTKRVNNGTPFTVGTNCETDTSGGLNKMAMRLLGATVGSETIQPPSYQCLVLATRNTGAFLGILYTVTTTTWYLIRIHNGISDISLNASTGAITFPSYTQYVYFW